MSARLSWRSARTAWRTSSIEVDEMLTGRGDWPAVHAMADAPRKQTPTMSASVLRTIRPPHEKRAVPFTVRDGTLHASVTRSVLAEQPLQVAVRPLFQQ